MDKAGVIERYKSLLNQLDEPAWNVIVSSGSALVVLGLRKTTSDLDVDIQPNLYKFFSESGKYPIGDDLGMGPSVLFSGDVDMHELNEDRGVVCIDGVWLYSPSELLVQKRYLANSPARLPEKREVDLVDIKALETLIKEQKPHTARVMA